ncbi:MAG: hypothetical protein M3N37_01005 [Actinomycetota bacterium]|nr:hypothetical protein [Actinomycetota bacterium]
MTREIDASRAAELTFNIFNVRIQPELRLIVIQDELDPAREATVPVDDFVRLMSLQ